MPSKRSQLPLAALLLGLVPLACGGAGAVADAPPPVPPEAAASAAIDANDQRAADDEDAVVEGWDERDNTPTTTVAQANAETDAEAITFDGEDADPELATQIRSAPERPPIPAFRLFGTRAGDGPG